MAAGTRCRRRRVAAAAASHPRPEPASRPVARPPVARPPGASPAEGRPLEGVRIIDLTSAWAGPMATRVLAALGADVVKIEGPARLDDWRGAASGGPPDRYPDFTPGDRPYDRHFQFNTQNHDKRSLVLDLKSSAGRDVARRLIAGADVVMANFSVGTLDRMGLGWAEVSQVAPAAILVEMPAARAGRPDQQLRRLRPEHGADVRDGRDHRLRRWQAGDHRPRLPRPHRGPARRGRGRHRPVRPRAQRDRPACRAGPDRGRHALDRRTDHRGHGQRPGPGAGRKPHRGGRAARRLPVRGAGRMDRHRGLRR